jgi:hypothetical protein
MLKAIHNWMSGIGQFSLEIGGWRLVLSGTSYVWLAAGLILWLMFR